MSKLDFIISTYEDGPIRGEKTNTLLKTYTHRCEEKSDETLSFEIATASLREPSQ